MLVTTVEAARELQHLLVESSRDPDLRQRLLAEPRKTIAAAGTNLRSDVEVRPVESTSDIRYLVIPTAPEEGAVPDDDLDGAAGGATPVFVISATPAAIALFMAIAVAIDATSEE